MNRFFNWKIPFYAAAIIVIVIAVGAAWAAKQYFSVPPDYRVLIPHGKSVTEFEYGSWPALSNPDFFSQVRQSFVLDKASFLEADLSAMRLAVYEEGRLVKQVPILSKGKEGSWWETPAGLYRIQTKEDSHFSSFGRVFMPWSMQFQGNFFIHGWPYYPSGQPVAAGYSGGCIRLSTEDAKTVFDLAAPGTPVLVYKEEFRGDGFGYKLSAPSVAAGAYLAADLNDNFILSEKNSEQVLPVASIAKLMTALVAVEYVNIEREIVIAPEDLAPTSIPRLRAGSKYSLFSLLHPLLMESSNEAAEAIAGTLGRGKFISLMNQKAEAIGMSQTRLTDPAGVEAANVSTARDVFTLARYLLHNRSFILKISAGEVDERTYGPVGFANLQNFNDFYGDSGPKFLGGKVGKSQAANETLLGVFSMEIGGAERPVAIIILDSPEYMADSRSLLNWAGRTYTAQ